MQLSLTSLTVAATALALSISSAGVVAAEQSPPEGSSVSANLPLVPIEDESQTGQAPSQALPAANTVIAPSLSNPGSYDKRSIKVESGVNEIVKVAQGHLNRIVTPFQHPQVRTTASNANTQVSGAVVYVAPSTSAPVTLYVTEKGDESVAVSLTLVPRRVPPRSFSVDVGGGYNPVAPAKAKNWERPSDYQQSITNVLRAVALGKIPPGYSMAEKPKSDPPYCYQKGLSFDFRQTLLGHDFEVAVGKITNNTGYRVEFSENSCLYERRVAAVSAWPNIVLQPGESSEVYTVLRPVSETIERQPARPSLIRQTSTAREPEQGLPGTFRVLLPPIESERVAREIVGTLRSKGFAAGTYRSGTHYTVRVSGYKSRGTATQAMSSLEDMGYEGMTINGGSQ